MQAQAARHMCKHCDLGSCRTGAGTPACTPPNCGTKCTVTVVLPLPLEGGEEVSNGGLAGSAARVSCTGGGGAHACACAHLQGWWHEGQAVWGNRAIMQLISQTGLMLVQKSLVICAMHVKLCIYALPAFIPGWAGPHLSQRDGGSCCIACQQALHQRQAGGCSSLTLHAPHVPRVALLLVAGG